MRATDWPPKMHKLRFALLSVAFIALAMGVYALQAGSALLQWLTGRTRRTFRIALLGPRRRTFRVTLHRPRAKEAPGVPGLELDEKRLKLKRKRPVVVPASPLHV